MKIKLHWKLTLIFYSAVIIGLIAGYGFIIYHIKGYVERNLENNLKHQILIGRDLVESYLGNKNIFFDADALADKIGKQLELRVTIIDKDGVVLGDSDLSASQIAKVENHLDRPEIQQAISKGMGISKRYSYTIKKYSLYIAVPFSKEKSVAGFIRYAVPISHIAMLEGKLKQTIIGAFLLVFLLSLLFTFFISLVVSKPLTEMAKIARAIAKGDFSRKPTIYSKDEIGDLALALSDMSDEIQNKIDRIKKETAKIDAVLSSMFEGIMVVDETGSILLMNPSLRKLFFVDSEPEKKFPIEAIRNPQVQAIVDAIIKNRQ